MTKHEYKAFQDLLDKFDKLEEDSFNKIRFLSEHKFEVERSAVNLQYEAYRECRLGLQWLLDDLGNAEEQKRRQD